MALPLTAQNIRIVININMRCIEIEQYLLQKMEHKEININMRCIEIFGLMLNIMVFIGLTLT